MTARIVHVDAEILETDLTEYYLAGLERLRDELMKGVPRFMRGAAARWQRPLLAEFARWFAGAHTLALDHLFDALSDRPARSHYTPPEFRG